MVCTRCFLQLRDHSEMEAARKMVPPIPKNFVPRSISQPEIAMLKPLSRLELVDIWQLVGDLADRKVLTPSQTTQIFDKIVERDRNYLPPYREFQQDKDTQELVKKWLIALAKEKIETT
mmetsp:Transcript_39162/g.84877  ORF Transcript_39162/g.84877 Transcript_39162/m.84877 type:complete len:119 (+) Transcript_39162:272-628(+)